MRIIDTFRYWKETLCFTLIAILIGLLVSNNKTNDEIYMKNKQIIELKDEIAEAKKEIQKQKELYKISEELREEMQNVIDDLEGEKEEFVSTTSNHIGQIQNNQEGMVKVINNGTQLLEALDKYIKNYNNWGPDDTITENSWKKVEVLAKCYGENVNNLKKNRTVYNCD